MKNPNGYGSVYKLKDKKRRRPWVVRVTDSWEIVDGKLKRKYKYIGYYETRKEAMKALSEYNVNPTFAAKDILFTDLYKMWSEEKFDSFSESTVKSYKTAFNTCKALYGYNFKDIRRPQLQRVIDESGKSYQSLAHIKAMLSHLYNYAIENDICDKNYAQFIDLTKYSKQAKVDKKIIHTVFTPEEIDTLWKNAETSNVASTVLIMIYTGVRISELLNLKKSDVHLSEQWFHITKSKTDAGIRDVPIANKILPLFKKQMETTGEYLLTNTQGRKYCYSTFISSVWKKMPAKFGINHLVHDTRHTFVSLLAEKKVEQTIIKKIVGHVGAMTVTEKVYTHYNIQPLLEAVNLI